MARRRFAIVLAVAVLAGAAGLGWTLLHRDDDYQHSLVKYGKGGVKNKYVDLDGSRLSFGSPDKHRIVVQWRDPDGKGWTEPETVWTDPEFKAYRSTAAHRGGTVAISQWFYNPASEDDGDARAAGIVCRDRRCWAETIEAFGSGPEVTTDGGVALVSADRQVVTFWTPGRGLFEVTWSNLPLFRSGFGTSSPALAPDGSLRVVFGKARPGGCTFQLFTSRPLKADLQTAGSTESPRYPFSAQSSCRAEITARGTDVVEVVAGRRAGPHFWFVRDGTSWRATKTAP